MAPAASPAQAMAAPAKANSSQRPDDEDTKPYVITQEIGKGSFATVYKGYHRDTHQAVAIKAVSRSILTQKLLENLKSEIDILKQLSYKHITQLTDILHSPSHIHLVMEFCAGGDLSQYIKSRGRVDGLQYSPGDGAPMQFYPHPRGGGLEQRCVRCFLRQLARALKFLRSRNLIHRDIKPQNLLLTPASQTDYDRGHPLGIPVLKVADFGFARILPNAMMAETLCGSPLYMAPEILRYEKYDAKADLWSVGAVLFEMSVGKPPFRAQNHIELLRKIEASKGIKFPEEDESHPAHPMNPLNPKSPHYHPGMGNTRMEEKMAQVVPDDLKALMRRLLVRKPTERASFEEFFSSQALRNSKFTIPSSSESSGFGHGDATELKSSLSRSGHKVPIESVPVAHRAPPAVPVKTLAEEAPGTVLSPRGRARLATKERLEAKKAEKLAKAQAQAQAEAEAEKERLASLNSPSTKSPQRYAEPLPPSPRGKPQTLREQEPQSDTPISEPVVDTPSPALVEAKGVPPRFRRPTVDGKRDSFGREEVEQSPRIPSSGSPRQYPTLSESDTIPGEAAEDGQLRRDYVVIDRKAVEFDRAVDEIQTNRRRPLHDRRASGTVLSDSSRITDLTISPLTNPTTFPPRPVSGIIPGQGATNYSPPLAGALARALSIASKRLFGSRRSRSGYSPPAKKAIIRDIDRVSMEDPVYDPVEETLLIGLEELAQKTQVLANWADEMYENVKAIPQKPLPDPNKFVRKEGEEEWAAQRRQRAEFENELQAVTCVALYMLLMGFSQRGIHALGRYKADLEMRFPEEDIEVSEGFDLALEWFKKNFIKCNDRVTRVKAWLPVEFEAQTFTWLDQLLYDRALELGRNAAGKEALNQLDEAEGLYEESLWCLRALRDEVLKSDGPFLAEDKSEVEDWIRRTDKRLRRCQANRAE